MKGYIQALRVACVLFCCAAIVAFVVPARTSARPTEETPNQASTITNGDFEAGTAGWSDFKNRITNDLPAPVKAHSGSYVAALTDSNSGSSISQPLTIPAATPYLSYWIWSASQEPLCNLESYNILISSPSRNFSVNGESSVCTRTDTNGWKQYIFDLSKVIGEQAFIEILFSTTDLANNSVIYIDDVSLVATPTPATKEIFIPITANGRSTAPTPSPIPTPAPISSDIQNGTFEQGTTGWTQYDSANRQLIVQNPTDITPRSGSWLARFDVGTNTLATMTQTIQLGATPQALRYYYFVKSINDCSGQARFQVYANDTLIDSKLICGGGNTSQWTTGYASLLQFEAQTVTLTFRVVIGQPAANPGEFIAIDDVSLEPLD